MRQYGFKILVGALLSSAFASAQAPTPVTVTGWNRDVVTEAGVTHFATTFDANNATWFQSGAIDDGGATRTNGLPTGTTITSAFTNSVTGGNSRFALQSVTINYAGGTTQVVNYQAPDWLASNITQKALAVDVNRNGNNGGGVGAGFAFDGQGFNLQENDIALSNTTANVTSLTFTNAGGAAVTGIFAVSFSPVSEPTTIVGVAALGLGLVTRLRRVRVIAV